MAATFRRLLVSGAIGLIFALVAGYLYRGIEPKNKSESISITSLYTGQTWVKYGLSDKALSTTTGAVMHAAFSPVETVLNLFNLPTLNGMLLSRHHSIDHILHSHIASGRVGAVIEVAAGLSPRGLRFVRQYPELLYYECDLPDVASRKLALLQNAGLLNAARHSIQPVDALAVAPDAPDSVVAIARQLKLRVPPGKGVAIVTEGLVNYFSIADAELMWRNFASAMQIFPTGVYVSDLNMQSTNGSTLETFFKLCLSILVKGRVNLHYLSDKHAESSMTGLGFAAVTIHDPQSILEKANISLPLVAAKVKIIEAVTGAGTIPSKSPSSE